MARKYSSNNKTKAALIYNSQTVHMKSLCTTSFVSTSSYCKWQMLGVEAWEQG